MAEEVATPLQSPTSQLGLAEPRPSGLTRTPKLGSPRSQGASLPLLLARYSPEEAV